MPSIRLIGVEGKLDIQGIYNYNKRDKDNNNYMLAKKDNAGIDFTSSRCLRHEMFKDLQPRQPISSDFKNHYIKLAGSIIGLLRGIMAAGDQLKRSSPLSVLDAYSSIKENHLDSMKSVFFDQCSSTKPNEENKDDKKNTNFFSKDNAPLREQNFKAFINIQQLQFIEQGNNQDRIVLEKDEKLFLTELKKTFKELNVIDECFIDNYKHINSLSPSKVRGILLKNKQISALIQNALIRMINIQGYKTGSFIKARKESFIVKLVLDESLDFSNEIPLIDFIKMVSENKFDFIKFYKKYEE